MANAHLLNMLLKLFVGIKSNLFINQSALQSFLIPTVLLLLWIIIGFIGYQKDGDYDAPPGMLYMQDKAELEEKERTFMLQ